jgi:putative transposase
MLAEMTVDLVSDALMMALWRRGRPRELLHHSDRSTQYTNEQCQSLMIEYGVVCSLSRSGDVWDNAMMESFFSTLKTERTARKDYRTRNEAGADVFDYIGGSTILAAGIRPWATLARVAYEAKMRLA